MRYPIGTIFVHLPSNTRWCLEVPDRVTQLSSDLEPEVGKKTFLKKLTLITGSETPDKWRVEVPKENLFTKLYLTLKNNG